MLELTIILRNSLFTACAETQVCLASDLSPLWAGSVQVMHPARHTVSALLARPRGGQRLRGRIVS